MKSLAIVVLVLLQYSFSSLATAQSCNQSPQIVFVNGVATSDIEAGYYATEIGLRLSSDVITAPPDHAYNRAVDRARDVVALFR